MTFRTTSDVKLRKAELLALDQGQMLELNDTRLLIYKFDPDDRSQDIWNRLADALKDFTDEDPLGVWRLRVIDRVGLDEGTLIRWGLELHIS